jgi:type III restriction enzyme
MKIQFDANLDFQNDAIHSVIDLFAGQPLAPTLFEISSDSKPTITWGDAQGIANSLIEDFSRVSANLREIQKRNEIPSEFLLKPSDEVFALDFTVEMETGTGKTYVYLKTVLELNRAYGYTKFIVVVPSIAIREGVVANLNLLHDHFASIYSGNPYEFRVYDSKRSVELREFAQSSHIQILVMNIDAFNKRDNLIFQERDATMGVKPISYIQGTNPIVIIDEPQNMAGDASKAALLQLNPMVTLRYSATHREFTNLIYRLTPVDAYNKKLVKRIEVYPVLAEADLNRPYVEVHEVKATKTLVTASVTIDVQSGDLITRKKVALKADKGGILPDLFDLSGEREQYRGYNVEDIEVKPPRVVFGNGVVVNQGEVFGTDSDAIQKTAIETAVLQSLKTELELKQAFEDGRIEGVIKPLTLFFIDRVANYYPAEGKFRLWFEEVYSKALNRQDFKVLGLPPVEKVHDGYFAVSAKKESAGQAKDSTQGRTTEDDARAYELIMKRKDMLMNPNEPLRFIWSHSALREGWDNPNVFTIATLNETTSGMKKRQEIGRGLRIPVMSNGERCHDDELNRLTIVANESYDSFASTLQKEIADDTSSSFDKRNIKNARAARPVSLKTSAKLDPDFKELWSRIAEDTRYRVDFDSEIVIARAVELLTNDPSMKISAPVVRVSRGIIEIDAKTGVKAKAAPSAGRGTRVATANQIPDLLGRIAGDVSLSRSSIAQVLIRSNRLGEVVNNPAEFISQVKSAIRGALAEVLVNGVKYERLKSLAYEMSRLSSSEANTFTSDDEKLNLQKSAFSEVLWDSDTERDFAIALENRDDVLWFVKLPWWFKVRTPVGNYNPDWAVCHRDPSDESSPKRLYLVRETKGVSDFNKLHRDEQLKIKYGQLHFDALGLSFEWTSDGDYDVPSVS